jgi:hypothetical protein
MRKIVFLLGILASVSCSSLRAASPDVAVYRSTTVTGNRNMGQVFIGSRTAVVFVDYQVLSTGNPTAVLEIFDTSQATTTALRTYTGYPTAAFVNYPLGIETTSGTAINIPGPDANVKVKVRYYIKHSPGP